MFQKPFKPRKWHQIPSFFRPRVHFILLTIFRHVLARFGSNSLVDFVLTLETLPPPPDAAARQILGGKVFENITGVLLEIC